MTNVFDRSYQPENRRFVIGKRASSLIKDCNLSRMVRQVVLSVYLDEFAALRMCYTDSLKRHLMNLALTEYLIIFLMCLPVILLMALAVVLIARRREMLFTRRVRCPHCAEWIMPEAKVCRYCGRAVDAGDPDA
jgi:hypothetical protein